MVLLLVSLMIGLILHHDSIGDMSWSSYLSGFVYLIDYAYLIS